MDTVLLTLVGVVGVLALIAGFLTIVLAVKKSLAAATTTPAGGATTPPAWKKVTDALWSVFTVQTFALIAAFNALELALYSSNWFPYLFEWPNVLHTLTYSALIVIASLLVKQQKGMVRTLALGAVIVASVIFTTIFFDHEVKKLTAWWNAPPSVSVQTTRVPAVPDRRVARTPAEPCDNIYRTYHLNNRSKPILRTDGCIMDWHVTDDGTVILTDAEGRDMPYLITKDTPDDLVTPLATKWRSRGSTALVEARFYRP